MTPTSRSRSPTTRDATQAIRTHDPVAQNDIITPVAAEGEIAPPIDEFRKIREAMHEWAAGELRSQIAEDEEKLRELGVVEPSEQIAIIHGGVTPTQDAATRGKVLERQHQEIVDDTSNISPVSPYQSDVPQSNDAYNSQAEWDDFPELDAKYGPPPAAEDFENMEPAIGTPPEYTAAASYYGHKDTGLHNDVTTEPFSGVQNVNLPNTSALCTGPCPIKDQHGQGGYLQQGQIPRVPNPRWGYSDPPEEIWEAWWRVEKGTASSRDQVEVDGFAQSHWWDGL
ncbi:MAG: hypothetical protein ASARMPREDX12_002352 [Alectoria sarmentosa]|nr:MAG: hypothetical protein ASARMPREDX12_002352 [Alectoria sarmentosa]